MNKNIKKQIPVFIVFTIFWQMIFGFSSAQNINPIYDGEIGVLTDSIRKDSILIDSDSLTMASSNTIIVDSLADDTIKITPFLDELIEGTNKDSLVYDVKKRMVYIYREGEITYQDMNLKADYMAINMDTKNIFAHGYEEQDPEDTTKMIATRPVFVQGGSNYEMDTITYNIDSEKAKIKGVATQEGEGFLLGKSIKKMPDGCFNIANGKYTTCDCAEPHFYLAMTKAKAIPGKKIIVGPSYFVMEDVPIYFLGLPFGFFPFMSDRQSGFIIPSYGEEYVKGFFMRNGGYYFAFNDYVDLTALGGFYTLGSWEASLASRYMKKYQYSGSLSLTYTKNIVGEKGSVDYINAPSFSFRWNHSQDSKFKPNSTFSASVAFSSSGFGKYGSQTLEDQLSTQTNSSIAYTKSWAGTPFSLSTNMAHSQYSRDSTVSLTFPNLTFNMSTIHPFKRKEAIGKEKWYEKISLRYTGTLSNRSTVKEYDLFTEKMFKDMKNGVNHTIPISTTLNLFNYINVTPNFNYAERWYFSKIRKEWSPEENSVIIADTTAGFYRVFDYNFGVSTNTKVYGTYQFGKESLVQAIRHVLTPTVGFSYTPDFGADKYGYYKAVQNNADGDISYYSPYEGAMYGVPGRGKSMSMNFGLTQTLEMKVKSDRDTTGVRKIKLIENLSATSRYNFLADSMNLSNFSLNLRTTIYGNFGLNISATLDPYVFDKETKRRINKFMLAEEGKLGRITSTGWSFGYTFNSTKGDQPAVNDINSGTNITPEQADMFSDPNMEPIDPNTQRALMTSSYYDFDIPWNFGFNYTMSYRNTGMSQDVTQTLGFNGSVTLTEKLGFTFNGGFDFETMELTPGTVTISRDLHCWQMSFTWVPIGYHKSWSFNIGVKSAMLQDIKYDKRSSVYDNLRN